MVRNIEKLSQLGFEITLLDKMPNVVLYREDNDWIYFIESIYTEKSKIRYMQKDIQTEICISMTWR